MGCYALATDGGCLRVRYVSLFYVCIGRNERFENLKILIVDDQASNRVLLSYLLQDDGHQVEEASNGEEAIAKYRFSLPDLVLMDVMMPGKDGYEVAAELKLDSKVHVPIIFLTALSDDLSLSKCIECGGDDFLTKPVNEVLLAAKIKAHERVRDLNSQLTEKNRELEKLHGLLREEHDLAEFVFEKAISSQSKHPNVQHYLSGMSSFSGDVVLLEASKRDTLFVLLGDFTGHGLPAALSALPVKQAFTFLVNEGRSLAEIASYLNHSLYEYLPSQMFCAASIIEFDPQKKLLEYWHGGLPDMLVLDTRGLIRQSIKSTHLALGVVAEKFFNADTAFIHLADNERLLVYSDGITDCCDVDGEMLGEDRFEAMLDGHVDNALLFDSVVERVLQFGAGRPQDDDMSILEIAATVPP
ncbi:MAG: CheY-like chemotaxis protein [Candidatus Pseudothioglobus sp.]|jgi:CheY-like chemotaxis protein